MRTQLSNLRMIEMANQALVFQQSHGNFDLHIRDLQVVWGYNSSSATIHHIPRMIEMKLIRVKHVGKRSHYRAVEM